MSLKSRFGRHAWRIAAACAAAAILATYDPKLYINGDNVDYMFLAREARAGALWSSDKYPPLFPLLLAPVQAVFGMRLLPQKLLVTAFAFGAVALLGRILRSRTTPAAGPWVLGAAATVIPFVEYAHYVMSEVPFLFFSLAALSACDRLGPGEAWRRAARSPQLWLVALFLAAAFYTRTAGAAGMLGVLLWLWTARRRRQAALLAAGLALLLLPWVIRAASGQGSAYFRQVIRINPYYPELGPLGAASLLARLGENAKAYLLELVPVTVFPALYGSTYSPPALQKVFYPIWLAAPLLLPLVGGAARAFRRRDPVVWWVAANLGLLLFWPSIWASGRFLAPAAPLLLWLWWDGWRWPEERRLAGPWKEIRSAALALLVILGVRNLIFYTIETREYPPDWGGYFSSLEWIREHTPSGAVVVDRKPGFVELVGRRRAVVFPREADAAAMIRSLREARATHVVLSALPYDDIDRFLRPAVERARACFRLVHRTPEPSTYVFEFYPEGVPGSAAPGAGR